MGYSWIGRTVLGVELPAAGVLTMVLMKVGDHDHPKTVKFDSGTGKPLWEEVPSSIFVDDPQYDWEGHEGLPEGFRVIMTNDERQWCETVVIGYVVGDACEGVSKPFRPDHGFIEKVKDQLQLILGDYGLWDEKKFGFITMCT